MKANSPEPRQVSVPTQDGHELVADLYSQTSGMPVLLLHGLSQQGRFWAPVISRMGSGPILALDQRGHGRSDLPKEADFGIRRCADDALRAMDEASFERTVVVGHSWGASVALELAVRHPDRVSALVLVDGGGWGIPVNVDIAATRERLRPPALGMPAEELWTMVSSGSAWFNDESRAALEPTFVVDEFGAIRTRIGMDRHMEVLDGLLNYDTLAAWESLTVPTWLVSCEAPGQPRALNLPGNPIILRWEGAVHDVPLQWPVLVAGLIDQVVEGATA